MGKNIKKLTYRIPILITNGRHAIVGDEPVSNKGTDLGFSPEDLIL
jgi:putative redox protein